MFIKEKIQNLNTIAQIKKKFKVNTTKKLNILVIQSFGQKKYNPEDT